MDARTAEAIVDELNAIMRDWFLPVGGGSMMLAQEVRARRYQLPGYPERIEIQARNERAWYWLTDGQIEGMLRRGRALVAV